MASHYQIDFKARTNADWVENIQLTLAQQGLNIAGMVLRMAVADSDGNRVLELKSGKGLEFVAAALGTFRIEVPVRRMQTLRAGAYRHDLISVLPSGETRTIWVGSLTIEQGVTRA